MFVKKKKKVMETQESLIVRVLSCMCVFALVTTEVQVWAGLVCVCVCDVVCSGRVC